jgi:hypothetical protein
MKFLRRIVPSPKKCEQENNTNTTVYRRVEVTVDRELVSILMPAHQHCTADETSPVSEPIARIPEPPTTPYAKARERTGPGKAEGRPPPRDASAETAPEESIASGRRLTEATHESGEKGLPEREEG